MSERLPAHGSQHPDEYREDLHPEAGRDDNVPPAEAGARPYRTAHEAKDVHDRLSHLNDEDLKRIPIVEAGTRLQQGATYLDLASDDPGEFTATAELQAGESQRLVAKDQVDHELWNVLAGHSDRPPRP